MNILKWLVAVFTVFGLSPESVISEHCGDRILPSGLVRNGSEVLTRNHWPWLAALILKEDGDFFCAGTLISLKTVITAAHCMQEKRKETRLNPSDFEVNLGRLDLTDDGEFRVGAKILEPIIIIAMHPDWNPRNIRYDADLALLIAAKEIESSFYISPICLQDRDIPNIINGTIVGWGFSSDTKGKTEDRARQADVEKVSDEDCYREDYRFKRIASERTFCVKGNPEGAGPCKGDSGGGFFTKLGDTWFIDGIVSSSLVGPESRCPSIKHSLLTKLSSFTKWIEQGMTEFYEVQFPFRVYTLVHTKWGSRNLLKVPEILRRGAFLSINGNSVDLGVDKLWCQYQVWRYFPNNIGYMFPNLKDLRVINMKIKSIERLNFKNMERLENLELTSNSIEQIPSNCFDDFKKLVRIKISDNKLKRIHADTFIQNPSLKSIYLEDNQIQPADLKNLKNANVIILLLQRNRFESIPFDAFDGMTNLTWIALNENKLTSFHKDTFLKNRNLTELWANDNQIQNLPEGLFRSNKKLNQLLLANNKITEINATFNSYGRYDFNRNVCISKNFSPSNSTELMAMNEDLQRHCGKN